MAAEYRHGVYEHHQNLSYSPISQLNTLDVYLPASLQSSGNGSGKVWIVYIHGGAWRDPLITSASVVPALSLLRPTERPMIAGVASLNYRLSPYPAHPTRPSSPTDSSRNAVHPEHLQDVLSAITWLQRKYGFGERYVLVGHSCGATLAFQAVMGLHESPYSAVGNDAVAPNGFKGDSFVPVLPIGVAGVNGIYDIVSFLKNHEEVPVYSEFIRSAFGIERQMISRVSPTSAKLATSWPGGELVVLGHSTDDELVEWAQTELMSDHLWREKTPRRRDIILKLGGKHDEAWADGEGLAKVIRFVLEKLQE